MSISSVSEEISSADFDAIKSPSEATTVSFKQNLPPLEDVERLVWQNFEMRVKTLEEGPLYATYEVDGVLVLRTPSPQYREWKIAQLQWREKKIYLAMGIFLLSLLVGWKFLKMTIPVVGGCVLVAGVGPVLDIANGRKKIAGWKQFPVIDERRKAYEGFEHVYKVYAAGKGDSYLAPAEKVRLFERYVTRFCDQHLQNSQVGNVQKELRSLNISNDPSLNCNPLTQKVQTYVYGYVPKQYEAVVSDMEAMSAHKKSVEQFFQSQQEHVDRQADRLRDESRRQVLSFFKTIHDFLERELEGANKERDEKLAQLNRRKEVVPPPNGDIPVGVASPDVLLSADVHAPITTRPVDVSVSPHVQVLTSSDFDREKECIEAAYKRRKDQLEMYGMLMMNLLQPYIDWDQRITRWKYEARKALSRLRGEHDQAVIAHVRGLLHLAKRAQEGVLDGTTDPFHAYMVLDIPTPPTVEGLPSRHELAEKLLVALGPDNELVRVVMRGG